MQELIWSHAEKTAARKAFDLALQREFDAVMTEAKRRTAQAKDIDDLWELQAYLFRTRKDIDNKYDYRYSQLIDVFARLISDGRLSEEELTGLREDEVDAIRKTLSFYTKLSGA
jgi:Photoprotection regulator fluorescence recovery protein